MNSLLILVPLFCVIILNLPFKRLMRKIAFTLALGLSLLQIILAVFTRADFFNGSLPGWNAFFNFSLSVDALSRVLLFCIAMVLFTALLVGKRFIKDQARLFNFTSLLLLILAGMNGVVLVKDIFSLYLFIEIVAVASFILIASEKKIDALEGAFKYIILSAFATALMLSAIAIFVLLAGNTGFAEISLALKNSPHTTLMMFAIGLFICGLFIKAGLMPFHGWLPDAYSAASAPVSVLLAGIVTKVVGVYTLIRLVSSVFGFDHVSKTILLSVGAFSIVAGALAAIGQNDIKRMLAYSSISQVGYIIIGLGCGTSLGIAGAVFHLFNHAIFKSLLFVNAASVESETGIRDMTQMAGLAQKMPVTGITSVLASLSAAGIPPLSGFWSKLIIIIALWTSGNHAFAVIAILAGIITLGYFLLMQRMAFFGKVSTQFAHVKEAGFSLVLPSLILGAIIVGAGLCFPFILDKFILPAGNIILGG